MKRFGLSVAALVIAGAACNAQAGHYNPMQDFSPYVGADFKYWHLSNDKDLGFEGVSIPADLFKEDYYGGAVNLGVVWCRMIGLEVGYEASSKRTKDLNNLNFTVGTESVVSLSQTKAQLRGPYVDLNVYYPIYNNCVDLIGSVGFSVQHPKFEASNAAQNISLDNKTRVVARAGGGLQVMFTDCIGARGLVRWENTKTIRAELDATSDGTSVRIRPFNDAVSVTLGMFVNFF